MSEVYSQGERQFSLLAAIRRPRGITRAGARRDIPAYAAYDNDESFRRAFERDIDSLRNAGYPIVFDGDVYRHDAAAPIITPLSALDVGLLRSLLSALGRRSSLALSAGSGMDKILARSRADSTAPRYLRASIPSGDDVVVLARALHHGRRVSFTYRASSGEAGYELEPARISEHYDAFYVLGAGRRSGAGEWSARTFRVDRIVPGTLSVTVPATHARPETDDAVFAPARARVAVRDGAAVPLLAQGRPSAEQEMEGWTSVDLPAMERTRLFEALVRAPSETRLLGDAELLGDWNARLEHLREIGGAKP